MLRIPGHPHLSAPLADPADTPEPAAARAPDLHEVDDTSSVVVSVSETGWAERSVP